jgi:hypothetical protein
MSMAEQAMPSVRPVGATIDMVCARIAQTMDGLNRLVEDEADLVRAGKLFSATEFKTREAELLHVYARDLKWLEARIELIRQMNPDLVEWLKHRHGAFRALMRINLAALATARELNDLRLQEVAERLRSRPAKPSAGEGNPQAA